MEKKLRFNIGDKVRIVQNTSGHGFDIGEVVVVEELFPNGDSSHYLLWSDKKIAAAFASDTDIEPVVLTVHDIKEGMRIKFVTDDIMPVVRYKGDLCYYRDGVFYGVGRNINLSDTSIKITVYSEPANRYDSMLDITDAEVLFTNELPEYTKDQLIEMIGHNFKIID